MKVSLTFLIILFLMGHSSAQCPDCIPDMSCVGTGGPTMCPEIVPDGTANEFYEEVITFYMPYNFNDPETGVAVTLNQVTVVDVQGIPLGMSYTLNSPDSTYFPSEGEEWGCVTICGTPLLPGLYESTITILADAEALGIPVESTQQFVIEMAIYEGDGTNNSFSYNVLTGCEEAEISFQGLINAEPQYTEWIWDFGNGNLSDQQFPPLQYYGSPGEYTVSLETNIYNIELGAVDLNSLSGGWSGDIEELIEAFSDPDPYFTIENSSGTVLYTSSVADNTSSNTWTGLSIALNEPPYSINFYDSDGITEDDFLGSFEFSNEPGSQYFNVNSGTSGFVVLDLVLDLQFNNEETVTIYAAPNAQFEVDEVNDDLFYDDASLVAFDWYFNGELLIDENTSELSMSEWGIYSCEVTNEFGCSSVSDEYTFCPDFSLTFDADDNTLLSPLGFESYAWYFNGELIAGENSNSLMTEEYGAYYLVITTDYGCEFTTEEYFWLGIDELNKINSIKLYPNPTTDHLFIELPSNLISNSFDLNIFDQNGKLLMNLINCRTNNSVYRLDHQLSSGMYVLSVSSSGSRYTQQFIVE